MAREDIIMDAKYGEVEMSGRVAGKTFHNFRLLDSVEDADNADFRHGNAARKPRNRRPPTWSK